MPFRFLAAYREVLVLKVGGVAPVQRAVSPRSKVLLYDVGLVLAILLQSRCQHVVTGLFGDRWQRVTLPQGQVLRNVQALYHRAGEVGYAINGYLVVQDLRQRRESVDKIMIFTDCQLWNPAESGSLAQEWAAYRATPSPTVYIRPGGPRNHTARCARRRWRGANRWLVG